MKRYQTIDSTIFCRCSSLDFEFITQKFNKFLTMSSSSPKGLTLGTKKHAWRIGKQLGSGACGAVHVLESSSSSEKRAIKLATLPPTSSNKRSKAYKEQNHNCSLLSYEALQYQNQLVSLRGKMIPDVGGKGLQVTGDLEGEF